MPPTHGDGAGLLRLIDQVTDYAIIALDPSGTIESWNAGASELEGYTSEEALGCNFSMFYTPEDRADGVPMSLLRQAREKGRVRHTGWRVRKDGTRFWGDVVITALLDEAGALVGYGKVSRDLTLEHDLELSLRRSEERFRLLVDQVTEYASTIASLASVLDVGRVVATVPPTMIQADRAAMQRVLTNLVQNALTYSEPPSVVEVGAVTDGARVRITVTDHGRGIDPHDLPTIFDEFERGRLAAGEEKGTGLGLSNVRNLVARQGGRAWIDSTPGEGTTVTVELTRSQRKRGRRLDPMGPTSGSAPSA